MRGKRTRTQLTPDERDGIILAVNSAFRKLRISTARSFRSLRAVDAAYAELDRTASRLNGHGLAGDVIVVVDEDRKRVLPPRAKFVQASISGRFWVFTECRANPGHQVRGSETAGAGAM
jgi:hypothetical protein